VVCVGIACLAVAFQAVSYQSQQSDCFYLMHLPVPPLFTSAGLVEVVSPAGSTSVLLHGPLNKNAFCCFYEANLGESRHTSFLKIPTLVYYLEKASKAPKTNIGKSHIK
jgi:hypothetical protein